MSSGQDPSPPANSPVPAATSFVVTFDSDPQTVARPPPNLNNKFVKKHMRNLSLPVANVYSSKLTNHSESNGVSKPPENHSEGYFSSDAEDETATFPQFNSTTTKSSSLPKNTPKDLKMNTNNNNNTIALANNNIPSNSQSSKFVVENGSHGHSTEEIEDGDKSDGGTYTIDQDTNDVINARSSIDKTFGIQLVDKKQQDYSKSSNKDSQDTKDWISEWANQVVEHNQKKSPIISCRISSKIPSPVYTRAKLPPIVPMNTPKTDLTPTSPPKQRSISLSLTHVNMDDRSDSSLETESYLRTTENIVSHMSARVNRSIELADSDLEGGRDDRKCLDQCSDSSCSETPPKSNQRKSLIDKTNSTTSSSSSRYNRAFSLRRNKNLNKSQEQPAPPVSTTNSPPSTTLTISVARSSSSIKKTTPNVTTKSANIGSSNKQAFSRTDCGRFSMRNPMVKSSSNIMSTSLSVPKTSSSTTASSKSKKPKASNAACRSNSTLSSREMEFQNWKRRKSYDPMKAAAEGKKNVNKKQPPSPNINIMSQSVCVTEAEKMASSVLRSASFHGTHQLAAAACGGFKSSSDDNEEDEEEEKDPDWNVILAPKTSLETTPRGSRTSLCSMGTNSSSSNVKLKTKIEGVDAMMITAIASMSCKLKANSSHFLKKLRVLYSEENAKHGLLTNEIDRLDLTDSSNNSPIKSPSRQLTSTLSNLKKIESALRVMDEAIFDCEEFE